jgi:hypothetical protein
VNRFFLGIFVAVITEGLGLGAGVVPPARGHSNLGL